MAKFPEKLIVQDPTDKTKQVDLVNVSGATTGTTTSWNYVQTANRTITPPDGTGTLAFNTNASFTTTGLVQSHAPVIASSVQTVTNAGYTSTLVDGIDTSFFSTGNTNRTWTLPNPTTCAGLILAAKKTDTGTGFVVTSANVDGAILNLKYVQDAVTIISDGTVWKLKSNSGAKFTFYNRDSTDTATTGNVAIQTTTVPTTSTYRIIAKMDIFTGTTLGNTTDIQLQLRTGSATYASATVRDLSSICVGSTFATARGRGCATVVWQGELTAGDSVHIGRDLTNFNGTGSSSNNILHIERVMTN